MKSTKIGAATGCVIWLITFGLLGSCLVPVALVVEGLVRGFNPELVARTLGPAMCPAESSAQVHTYPTTLTDSDGFESPATGYELRCINANGAIAKDLGPFPFFIWTGIAAGAGLALAALLALLLAAPAGAFIARVRMRSQ